MQNVRSRGVVAIASLQKFLSKKGRIRAIVFAGIFVLIFMTLVIVAVSVFIEQRAQSAGMFSSLDQLPERRIGIVLGASVRQSGKPSDVLADRLDTAIEAFRSGKIHHFLLSGDNSTVSYNEPEAMKKYLIARGIPLSAITADYAGFDTYDTMWRARSVFGVDNAVIFTQDFHLSRSVYIADALGISVVGMASDRQRYLSIRYFTLREMLSRVKAFIEVISGSQARFTGPREVILISH